MEAVEVELKTGRLNKQHVELNFTNIIDTFSTKMSRMSSNIDALTKEQELIKVPLTEYCNMLNMELSHVNQQNEVSQQIQKELLKEVKQTIVINPLQLDKDNSNTINQTM